MNIQSNAACDPYWEHADWLPPWYILDQWCHQDETQKIAAIAQAWPGTLLLSDAAIGSLPPPVIVSSLPVGDVDELSFRLALSGFGYEIADPSAPSVTNLQSVATPALDALGVFEPRGWVEKMLEAMPQIEQTLRNADIWDDESYIANEHELETSTRHVIGMTRYTLIAGEKPSASGILNNLHACPPWFLNEKLQNLDTTVRMANVFKGNNLWTVAHIAEKGYNGLLRLPNLGQGSVHGIGRLLYEALINRESFAQELDESLRLGRQQACFRHRINGGGWPFPINEDSTQTTFGHLLSNDFLGQHRNAQIERSQTTDQPHAIKLKPATHCHLHRFV